MNFDQNANNGHQRAIEYELWLVDCEQYSRNRSIEIKGIPSQQNENGLEIVKKAAVAIDKPILETDVEVCHWVPIPNITAKNIVVQFMGKTNGISIHAQKQAG